MAVTSCTTVAKLTRFAVYIKASCGTAGPTTEQNKLSTGLDSTNPVLFTNCIKATGLTMGEEGTVEVPQWGVTGMLADGQRKLSPLGLDFRIEDAVAKANAVAATPATLSLTEYVFNMFENRANYKYDITVVVTDRGFTPLFYMFFSKCDMRKLNVDDQELGAGKLGIVSTEFLPYDVELKACDNSATMIHSKAAVATPTITTC